jgi:hypothetical protein
MSLNSVLVGFFWKTGTRPRALENHNPGGSAIPEGTGEQLRPGGGPGSLATTRRGAEATTRRGAEATTRRGAEATTRRGAEATTRGPGSWLQPGGGGWRTILMSPSG